MHRSVTVAGATTGLSRPGRLTHECDASAFACGDAVIDAWIRRRALRRDARGARTFAVCEDGRIAGFFCLAAGLVAAPEEPPRPRLPYATPARDPIPVAILRRLAVDAPWQGRGLGADLLMDALQRIVATGAELGVRAVLARAVEDRARAFYAAFGFAAFSDDAETMLLPVETAEGALRAG
ncbi:GNAT family N-acetyltransferase [Salinarimonas sp.]|uniref:GNAT family N-acetyltransferase n=1 Tax=Salinarimonas sp. TaxID=2766526 RepID=UPI0032D94926